MREKYCNNCERVLSNFESLKAELAEAKANWEHFADLTKEYHALAEKMAGALEFVRDEDLDHIPARECINFAFVFQEKAAKALAEWNEFKNKGET